jgi:WD40 repeat protein
VIFSVDFSLARCDSCFLVLCFVSAAVAGRGQSVVSGSSDGHVNMWNCATQQCLRAFKPASVDADLGSVYDCVLADSDNVCLAATQSGCIVGWDLRSGASMFSGGAPSSAVNTICMLPDAITFACGHQDGVLCLFDVRKSRCGALGFAIRPKAVFDFLSMLYCFCSIPLGSWRRSAHAIMRVAAPSPSGDGSLRLLSGSSTCIIFICPAHSLFHVCVVLSLCVCPRVKLMFRLHLASRM